MAKATKKAKNYKYYAFGGGDMLCVFDDLDSLRDSILSGDHYDMIVKGSEVRHTIKVEFDE